MLYPFQLIAEARVPVFPLPEEPGTAVRFLRLVHRISARFGEAPAVLHLPDGAGLTLLYRDLICLWQDIADCAASDAAALSDACPLVFYGTTEGRETAELTILPRGGEAVVRLRSVSGRPFDHLQGLAIQAALPDAETAAWVAALCRARPFCAPCAVLPQHCAAHLQGSTLMPDTAGSRFSYLTWEPCPAPALLFALTASHKVTLWREFLLDGLQPLEFAWLWEGYYTQEPLFLLEWELSLRMVLASEAFDVQRSLTHFRVTDRQGGARLFDFARGGPAEKIFLKLLFPLDAR